MLLPAAIVLALVGAWELYVELGGVDPLLLPAPHAIAQALYEDRSLLWSDFLVTGREVAFGILAALALGLGAAILMHANATARRAVYPLLIASQAWPIVIYAPILVYWAGFGVLPKLAIIAVICFFPVAVTTLDALGRVDPDQPRLLRTLDASRWQIFRWVELPAAAPAALSGARISIAVAVIAAVFAEYSGSTAGLGHLMLNAIPQLETARAFAAAVVLSVFAVALFYGLALAERRLLPQGKRP